VTHAPHHPHPRPATPAPGPPHRDARALPTWAARLPWLLAGGGVLTQITFPLTGGGTYALTVAAVVLLAASALTHALTRGVGTATALVVVVGGGAFAAEAIGLWTAFPFGAYDYTGTLGPEAAGVPLLVPLAWIMMAWPALLAARHLLDRLLTRRPRWLTVVVAAWALTAWDVFLDPQMVDAGHWAWDNPTPALPGVPGIPVTNFVGWLVVSLVITLVLDPLAGDAPDSPDGAPLAVFCWTYLSSVMANAVFFGRPWVALVGALVMGVVAVPLLVVLVREHRHRRPGEPW